MYTSYGKKHWTEFWHILAVLPHAEAMTCLMLTFLFVLLAVQMGDVSRRHCKMNIYSSPRSFPSTNTVINTPTSVSRITVGKCRVLAELRQMDRNSSSSCNQTSLRNKISTFGFWDFFLVISVTNRPHMRTPNNEHRTTLHHAITNTTEFHSCDRGITWMKMPD